MGKGGYRGGSTIVGPWSAGWFSGPKPKAGPTKEASAHAAGKASKSPAKAKGAKRKPVKMSDARITADAEEKRLRKTVQQSAPVNMTGVAKRSKKQKNPAAITVPKSAAEAQRAGMTRDQWQAMATAEVRSVEKRLLAARQAVSDLLDQLRAAEAIRQVAYQTDVRNGSVVQTVQP
ncbi:hypothetical protein NYR55_04290 [Sphingomonas sp. BGYR3]|uniref:hypothetical protein n=1 Tax=Sphingomonas sp. BGYR3 TaxID=2975483 RepID=UPI0021A4E0E5|nr:hypothetical protein [Sphingomonas sp. BGYR3]MDG5487838.1 hypothetical protein [Sphingomonas sp. BGYR3]